jgi:putative ABC transport system ATP-binding protein
MLVQLDDISKIYRTHHREVEALKDVSLQVEKGEFAIIRGSSGSGKTTLLMTIGGMLRPTKGLVNVDGNDIYKINERERAGFRAENIGFVFQMFHLVPYLNVMENVLLSSVGKGHAERVDAQALLKRLNMSDREYHRPSELSAGEKQRVAIARALLNRPKIVLADEPTGNLDPENAAEVIGYLAEFRNEGGTVIVATHADIADQYANNIIHLRQGRKQL